MNIRLDYEQRLYLHLMLGNLECRTVSETRATWELMDRIGLDEVEKHLIDYKVQNIDQQEAYSWDLSKTVNGFREFSITEPDIKQIARALTTNAKFIPRQARRWLEPLLQQLPQLEDLPNSK